MDLRCEYTEKRSGNARACVSAGLLNAYVCEEVSFRGKTDGQSGLPGREKETARNDKMPHGQVRTYLCFYTREDGQYAEIRQKKAGGALHGYEDHQR